MNRPRTRDSGRPVHVDQEGSIDLTPSTFLLSPSSKRRRLALTELRLLPSASISSATVKTRTLNSASSLSNPASTAFRDITNLLVFCRLRGDMRVRLRARWWLRLGQKSWWSVGSVLRVEGAVDGSHAELEQGMRFKSQV